MKIRKYVMNLLIVVALLMCGGCGEQNVDFYVLDAVDFDWQTEGLRTNWEQLKCLGEIQSINSDDEALEFGRQIIKELHDEGRLRDYCLDTIYHYTNDNIWLFRFFVKDEIWEKKLGLYPSFCVMVNGNKGELIGTWGYEG